MQDSYGLKLLAACVGRDSEATSPTRPILGTFDDTSGDHLQEANTLAAAEQVPNSPIAIPGANRDAIQVCHRIPWTLRSSKWRVEVKKRACLSAMFP